MKARWLLPLVPVTFVACHSASSSDASIPAGPAVQQSAAESAVDASDAFQAAMEASDVADMGSPFGGYGGGYGGGGGHGFSGGNGGGGYGCVQHNVISTGTVCGHDYPSDVQIVWNCTSSWGPAVSGSAEVLTTITAPNCPPDSFTVQRQISIDRTRSHDDKVSNLAGTASLEWDSATATSGAKRHLVYSFERKKTDAGTPVKDTKLSGDTTVAWSVDTSGNGGPGGGCNGGDFDGQRVVNGTEEVKHVLAGTTLDATETNLTFAQDCCYPVSGTFAYQFTTTAGMASGSLTFGPSCGDATTQTGGNITLPSCHDEW